MLWHYLVFAVRSLTRNPFQTAVSILGLALGLACFIGATLFASYVNSADRQHANAERIYVMFQKTTVRSMGMNLPFWPDTSVLLAERLQAEFPEVTDVGRSRDFSHSVLTVGAERSFRDLWLADTGFMRILAPPLAFGTDGTADGAPQQLLLTLKTAEALFGHQNVVGEIVNVSGIGDIEVAGVLKALPDPSHYGGVEGIVVTRPDDDRWAVKPDDPWGWSGIEARTYVLLNADHRRAATAINTRLPDFVQRNVRSSLGGVEVTYDLRHVSAMISNEYDSALWDIGWSLVDLLRLLGALVLSVACLNFINLATARAVARAKEVGLRKAVGARRKQVVTQHLLETLLIVGAAGFSAVMVLELSTEVANKALDLSLAPPSAAPLSFWLSVGAVVLVVVLAAGGYPALLLGRTRPVHAFGNSTFGVESSRLRAALMTAQFAVAGFLVVLVAVVATQNAALRLAGVSLGRDPLVVVPTHLAEAKIDPEVFRTRLLESPYIKEVTGSEHGPWEPIMGGTGFTRTPADMSSFVGTQQQRISYGYFETIETALLAGRFFSRDHADAADPNVGRGSNLILDRRAAEEFGWPNPADAIGEVLYSTSTTTNHPPNMIVGVVEHAPTRVIGGRFSSAFIYWLDPDGITVPIIRVSATGVEAALAHIDAVWKSLAPTIPIEREFADERFAVAYELFAIVNRGFTALAGIAIAISALGLFGMAAYVVGRRRRELAIRKSQGANTQTLLGMLLGQFLRPVLIANLIAIPGAFVAAQTYLSLFVKPVPLTPTPFVAGVVTTLLVAALVVSRQVWNAARVRPADLLRYE